MLNNYLEISSSDVGDGVIKLDIVGRLDESTFHKFTEKFRELNDSTRDIIIDLSDLKYISSSGIRAFFDLKNHLTANGIILVLLKADEKIIHIFSLLGLWKTFSHFQTVESAKKFILDSKKRP